MNEKDTGLQISRKSFISSVVILFTLMLAAGILTRAIPAGEFERVTKAGREVLVPESYQLIGKVNYPIWRWLTAPIEVLWGPDAATVIVIIVFILLIGGSVAVLDKSGILRYSMQRLVNRFGQRKYVLIGVLVFFFMALGALIGTFEEIVVLVPLTIGLAISLGWDSLTGLGMSLLAAGFGFAAAISNPFTVGVAQRLAGLPAFSGVAYRVLIFLIVYVLLLWFLVSYAKKVEKSPEDSLVYNEDQTLRVKYATEQVVSDKDEPHLRSAIRIFSLFLLLILAVIVAGFFVEAISAISLPLVAIVFTVGAICSGVLSKYASAKGVVLDLLKGMTGILPAILLILMAMSVKHIMVAGKTMDTVLQWAADRVGGMSPYMAGLSIYILILFLELFISSGSAKAFLVIPIVAPLVDIIGLTRQSAVLAFTFGDGFSNVFFPTNAVLMIALGLTTVSFVKWLKWTVKIQLTIFVITILMLFGAIAFGYGPY